MALCSHLHLAGSSVTGLKSCIRPSSISYRLPTQRLCAGIWREAASRVCRRAVEESVAVLQSELPVDVAAVAPDVPEPVQEHAEQPDVMATSTATAAAAAAEEEQPAAGTSAAGESDLDALLGTDNKYVVRVSAETRVGSCAGFVAKLLRHRPGVTIIVSASGPPAEYQALKVIGMAHEMLAADAAGGLRFQPQQGKPRTANSRRGGSSSSSSGGSGGSSTGRDGDGRTIRTLDFYVTLSPEGAPARPDVADDRVMRVRKDSEVAAVAGAVYQRLEEQGSARVRGIGPAVLVTAVRAIARARYLAILHKGFDAYVVPGRQMERVASEKLGSDVEVVAVVLHVHKSEAREGAQERLLRARDRRAKQGRGQAADAAAAAPAAAPPAAAAVVSAEEWQGMKQQLEQVAQSVSSLVSELQQQQQYQQQLQ